MGSNFLQSPPRWWVLPGLSKLLIIFDFLENREVVLKASDFKVKLQTGVPQGSCLSPTLYNVYLADLPDGHISTVVYADDITQRFTVQPRSSIRLSSANFPTREERQRETESRYRLMLNEAMHEIKQTNEFEHKWKIRTNLNKFTMVPICQRGQVPYPRMNNIQLSASTVPGNLLGLKIGRFNCHVNAEHRLALVRKRFKELRRLYFLSQDKKVMLYKMVLRPILAYPAIPSNTLPHGRLEKYEAFERHVARWIFGYKWDDFITTPTLDRDMQSLGWESISLFLHNRARDEWNRIRLAMPELYEEIKQNMKLPNRLPIKPVLCFRNRTQT